MKTQLRKPARSKARYTEEYKQEALELWRNSGRSYMGGVERGERNLWFKKLCAIAQTLGCVWRR